jgi:phosphocarrier protein HPr
MRQVKLVLKNQVGLHARPAASFVSTAKKYRAVVKISMDNREVDAKSILSVLSLGANSGAVITVCATGDEEEQAIAALAELVNSNFGAAHATS